MKPKRPPLISQAICVLLWSAEAAYGQIPCPTTEEKVPASQPVTLPLSGGTYTIQSDSHVSLIPSGQFAIVNVRSVLNLQPIQADFRRIVLSSGTGIPGSNCNNRFSEGGFFLRPSGDRAEGGFNVHYERWECVSAHVPCPTWRDPFRFCRQDAKTKTAETNISIRTTMTARVTADEEIKIDTAVSSSGGDMSGPLAFLGSIVGGLAGGSFGAVVGGFGGAAAAKSIQDRIRDAIRNISAPTIDVPNRADLERDLAGFEMELRSARFVDLGGGVLGLEAVAQSTPRRPPTACFIRSKILGR